MSRPGLFEQELRVDLRLRNPNDFAIGIERVRFALEVNDKTFANGRTNQAFELPALGEAVVPVTVSVPTNDLIDRLMEVGSERRLEYRLSGEAELRQPAVRHAAVRARRQPDPARDPGPRRAGFLTGRQPHALDRAGGPLSDPTLDPHELRRCSGQAEGAF